MKKKYSTKKSISATSLRKYIIICLKNADRKNLKPQDLLSRVSSAWECKTVYITVEKEKKKGFHFLIGLHTVTASKHNYISKSKNLFPEFTENECKVKSVKGAGTWARSLIDSTQKPILVFGESSFQELVQLARSSQQHKKAQRLSPGPETKKKKNEKKVRKRTDGPERFLKTRFGF